MPRVETYGPGTVAPTALPSARRQAHETVASQGGAIGAALADVGAQVANRAITTYDQFTRVERQRADEVANLTTVRRFNELENALLHDPESGILAKTGLAPMEGRDQVLEAFDTASGEIGAGLTTDEQRIFFAQQKVARRGSVADRVDTHASNQLQVYEAREMDALLTSTVNTAIANATDRVNGPRIIAEQLAAQEQAIDTVGPRRGLGPDARADLKAKLRSETHVGVIERLLAVDQDVRAQSYFEGVQDQITDAKERTRVTALLEAGSLRGRAQRTSDAILATATTLDEAMGPVKAITDPKERDEVQGRVEHAFAVRAGQERVAHEAMVTKGKNIVDRTGDWRRIPFIEWEQYNVGEAGQIKQYAENKARGVTVQTNPNTYAELTELARSTDPVKRKAFQQTSLPLFVNHLSTSDYQHFVDLQASTRAGDEEQTRKLLSNTGVQNQIVDAALVSMALDPSPPQPGATTFDPVTAARVADFRRAVREAVTRLEQRPDRVGKPATDAEVLAITDQLRTPTGRRVVKDRLWPLSAITGPTYAFETAQAQAATVEDIPPGERRRLADIMRQEGVAPTDTRVLRYFNLLLQHTRKDR